MRNRKQAFDFFMHLKQEFSNLIKDCHRHSRSLSEEEFHAVVGFCHHFYYTLDAKLMPIGFASFIPESPEATHKVFCKDNLFALSKIAFTEFNAMSTSKLHEFMFKQNNTPFGKFVAFKLRDIAVQLGAFVSEYVPINDIFSVDCMFAFKSFIAYPNGRLFSNIREQLVDLHKSNMKTYQYFNYESASLFLTSVLFPIHDLLLQSVTAEDDKISGPQFPLFSSQKIWTTAFLRKEQGMVETVFDAIEKRPTSLTFEDAKNILEGLCLYSVWYKFELASKCLQIALSDLKLHIHYAHTATEPAPLTASAVAESSSSRRALIPPPAILASPDNVAALTEADSPLPPMPPLVPVKEKSPLVAGHASFFSPPSTPPLTRILDCPRTIVPLLQTGFY